jgi:hypothetical protein
MATQPGQTERTIVLVHTAAADASGIAAEVRAEEDRGSRAIGSAAPPTEQTSPPGGR